MAGVIRLPLPLPRGVVERVLPDCNVSAPGVLLSEASDSLCAGVPSSANVTRGCSGCPAVGWS